MTEYTKEQIDQVYEKINQLIQIVGELEKTFKGRHFTLDGHLVGSIGEIMASYYYGIKLYEASVPIHDGITDDGKEVQIKITQQNRIVISDEPTYLIVLYLNIKTGNISEVYNGLGKIPWEEATINKKRNTRYIEISKLLKLDKQVEEIECIPMINKIDKYSSKELVIDNSRKKKRTSKLGKTLVEGYINKNNQENCGSTGKEGNLKGQMLYKMKCLSCGCEYESNGCDVWLRKCPKCM